MVFSEYSLDVNKEIYADPEGAFKRFKREFLSLLELEGFEGNQPFVICKKGKSPEEISKNTIWIDQNGNYYAWRNEQNKFVTIPNDYYSILAEYMSINGFQEVSPTLTERIDLAQKAYAKLSSLRS